MCNAVEARTHVEFDGGWQLFFECTRHQIKFTRPSVNAVKEEDEVRAVGHDGDERVARGEDRSGGEPLNLTCK